MTFGEIIAIILAMSSLLAIIVGLIRSYTKIEIGDTDQNKKNLDSFAAFKNTVMDRLAKLEKDMSILEKSVTSNKQLADNSEHFIRENIARIQIDIKEGLAAIKEEFKDTFNEIKQDLKLLYNTGKK